MGIVKIASLEPAAKSGYSCGDEDLTREDRLLLQSFPDPESLGSEQAEVDCELAASRGQMCNIPYELYDLGDLTEVLSLETWNSLLTEDDRLHLAAYLPDMEQQDFVTTMKELFSGDAMQRELLMMLQTRRHYHFLKWYHDGMVGKFASMSNLLRSSDTSASLGEKVPISRNRVYEKRFPCVSLSSTTPPVTIKDEIATVSSPMKRAKLRDGPLSTHCSTRHNEIAHVAKSAEMNSLESQTFHSLSDPRQNCSKLPKGVLKIRTGCASVIDGSEGTHHRHGLVRADQPGTQSSRFCTPPLVFAHDVHGFSEHSSSHTNRINGTSASSQCTPLQWQGTLEPYALMGKIPLGVQMTVPEERSAVYPSMMLRGFYQPAANHSLAYSSEACDIRECAHMKDLLKNFGGQNIIVHQSSPDPYARVRDGHQMNGYSTMHSLRNAESISEMLSLGTRIYPPQNNVSEQLETMRKHHDGTKLEPPPAKPVTETDLRLVNLLTPTQGGSLTSDQLWRKIQCHQVCWTVWPA
ncbi:unnamed protein product [Miscanthus lutarioriparius]|uniref:Uncharacterized protein n=1 Tax=Miscanthus lutarioriparius TaxID=422564 RepID=A0A811R3F2_9POAL|nr:unnamed protein product [Miscanthus lutarioriparius]